MNVRSLGTVVLVASFAIAIWYGLLSLRNARPEYRGGLLRILALGSFAPSDAFTAAGNRYRRIALAWQWFGFGFFLVALFLGRKA